jgi:hypothetical protein
MHLTDNALRRGRSNQCDSPRGSGGGPNARSAGPAPQSAAVARHPTRPIVDWLVDGAGCAAQQTAFGVSDEGNVTVSNSP